MCKNGSKVAYYLNAGPQDEQLLPAEHIFEGT
jgi:hypothetical protein